MMQWNSIFVKYTASVHTCAVTSNTSPIISNDAGDRYPVKTKNTSTLLLTQKPHLSKSLHQSNTNATTCFMSIVSIIGTCTVSTWNYIHMSKRHEPTKCIWL